MSRPGPIPREVNILSEAELILSKLEAKNRSYRLAFLCALAGLTTMVAANVKWGIDSVIRGKSMSVLSGTATVGIVAINDHKVVLGTMKGPDSLVSAGEGATGAGIVVLSGPNQKKVINLSIVKNGGGSVGINGPDGTEIANASPNVSNVGSLFIDNAAGTLIGEINGDKINGGAIVLHDSTGKEIARVHQ
jgi:hypothetical protein